MDLFKKTALPSIEDFAKDIAVKKNLTSELGKSIRVIQEDNVGRSVIADNDFSSNLCSVLEAIFIHGLKDKITRKVSSVFASNPEKIPEPQFWSAVSNYSHKNVILEINHFNQITNDVGRGRAWLRLALNDGLIVSYVGNMLTDKSSLQKHYNSNAYIRDDEQSDIMKQLLEGLSTFGFELCCNNSTLNVWHTVALSLANVWTPPITPQPVMPAVDVIDFFTDPKNQSVATPKHAASKVKKASSVIESEERISVSTETVIDHNLVLVDSDIASDAKLNTAAVKTDERLPTSNCTEDINVDLPIMDGIGITNPISLETSSKISSSDSVPDFGLEIVDNLSDTAGSMGNRLSEGSGWSSAFDVDQESVDQSYDSLLQSYNKNLSKVVIGTPELADTFSALMRSGEEDEDSSEAKSPDLDFEIVPKYLALDHADEETKKLLSVLGQLCPEKGLSEQDFKCNACGRPVGIIYGKARLCYYDGFSYCYECHENDEEIIPSRIVHNWDFKKYPISKRAKAFVSRVVKDPLLDMKVLNPVIYSAVEEMAQMQLLRTQLTFLRSYIFTCKQSIAEELRTRLWPREYLLEHVHLYAVDDMLEIAQGALAQTLQKVISFAKAHVSGCQLCLLKGFICEVCNNPKPIYPFDIETTYHCDKCFAVYHATCMDVNKYCPKCIRKMKRQKLLESSTPD